MCSLTTDRGRRQDRCSVIALSGFVVSSRNVLQILSIVCLRYPPPPLGLSNCHAFLVYHQLIRGLVVIRSANEGRANRLKHCENDISCEAK